MKTSTSTMSGLLAALLTTAVVIPHADAVGLAMVGVGDKGNLADNTTGYGAVNYNYQISKYEVTINQYTEFLNAVAATDTYNLYNDFMGSDDNIKGITQSGSSGSYSYSVIGDSGDRPITYVSWFDAARFANWLANGCPTGDQVAGITETGTYALNGATSGIIVAGGGGWRLPTEDEWYKAAYYDPSKGELDDGDNYWDYAMTLDNLVDNSTSANYNDGDYATTQSATYDSNQNYLTDVGFYTGQDSYYGTYDQSGNVFEWTDGIDGGSRVTRGGSWDDISSDLLSSFSISRDPSFESSTLGFRLAVPEPSSVGLLVIGAMAFALRRKRA